MKSIDGGASTRAAIAIAAYLLSRFQIATPRDSLPHHRLHACRRIGSQHKSKHTSATSRTSSDNSGTRLPRKEPHDRTRTARRTAPRRGRDPARSPRSTRSHAPRTSADARATLRTHGQRGRTAVHAPQRWSRTGRRQPSDERSAPDHSVVEGAEEG